MNDKLERRVATRAGCSPQQVKLVLAALRDGDTWDGHQVANCEVIDADFAEARKAAAEEMREQCAKALQYSLLPKPVSDAAAELIRALEVDDESLALRK